MRQPNETVYACHCGWEGDRKGAAAHWQQTDHDPMVKDGGPHWWSGSDVTLDQVRDLRRMMCNPLGREILEKQVLEPFGYRMVEK